MEICQKQALDICGFAYRGDYPIQGLHERALFSLRHFEVKYQASVVALQLLYRRLYEYSMFQNSNLLIGNHRKGLSAETLYIFSVVNIFQKGFQFVFIKSVVLCSSSTMRTRISLTSMRNSSSSTQSSHSKPSSFGTYHVESLNIPSNVFDLFRLHLETLMPVI